MQDLKINKHSKQHRKNLIIKWRKNADFHRRQVLSAEQAYPELRGIKDGDPKAKGDLIASLGEGLVSDYQGLLFAIEASDAKCAGWEAAFLKDYGHRWNDSER